MSSKPPFSGDGFSRDPIDGEDAAKHREMYREISDAWASISGLNDITKGGKRVAQIAGVLAVLSGVVAYLIKQGLVG